MTAIISHPSGETHAPTAPWMRKHNQLTRGVSTPPTTFESLIRARG